MRKILPAGVVLGAIASAGVLSACGAGARPAAVAGAAAIQAPAGSTARHHSQTTLRTARLTVAGHTQTIIVTASGKPAYLLTGDSRTHPECTSAGCEAAWPLITAAHPSGTGVTGRLGIWRHGGVDQVTIDGHPIYTYAGDSGGAASGQGLRSFGGTWLVLSPAGTAIGERTAHTSTSDGAAASSAGGAIATSAQAGTSTGSSGGGW